MFHSVFCLNDLSVSLDHNYMHIFICSPVHPKQNQVMCHRHEPYRTPPHPISLDRDPHETKPNAGWTTGQSPWCRVWPAAIRRELMELRIHQDRDLNFTELHVRKE